MTYQPAITPLFVTDRNAAKLLDMSLAEFVDLVEHGALPGPVRHGRWDVEELRAIMRGDKAKPHEELEL